MSRARLLAWRGAEAAADEAGVGAAALGMGVVLAVLRIALAPMLVGHAMLQVGALAALVCAGLATFAALALGLGVADWRDVLCRLRRQPA